MLIAIPSQLYAGDTLIFETDVWEHPHGQIKFSISNHHNTYTFEADEDHLVSISAATTATWVPGKYRWTSFHVDGDQRTTLQSGDFEILPDPSVAGDNRSHAQKMVDAIETALEETAGTELTITINGRTVTYERREALNIRNQYRKELVQAKRGGRAKKIYTRFI